MKLVRASDGTRASGGMEHFIMGNSRVCARIDLDAVRHNFSVMRSGMREDTKICAVVKTDAYGHGAAEIASMLEKEDWIWGFAVAAVPEGVSLRDHGIRKPILVLGFTFREDYETMAALGIRPAVFRLDMAMELSEAALRCGTVLPVHIAVDTGMTRIGLFPGEEAVSVISSIAELPGLNIEGIFTHFARADEADKSNVRAAFGRFSSFCEELAQKGISIPIRHCSNSACILEYPEAHMDMVRAGITIYGIYPSDEVARTQPELKPVMQLKSHIAAIREVPSGTPVSYGGTFVTERVTRVATIPVGYGDGYPRSLSGKGCVLIGGKRAPILGRVCMDQFMVDVTDIPAHELEEVTLMGEDHGSFLSVYELSELSGRFPYEFVCVIGKRVPREYANS